MIFRGIWARRACDGMSARRIGRDFTHLIPAMKPLISLSLAAALLAAPAMFNARAADAAEPSAAEPSAAGAAGTPGTPSELRFDIELAEGMSAEEALGVVAERVGHGLNVVWTGESSMVKLPAVRLHQITIREFFAAITAAGREELKRGQPGFMFNEVAGAPNVYTFSVIPAPGSRHVPGADRIPMNPPAATPNGPPAGEGVNPNTGEPAGDPAFLGGGPDTGGSGLQSGGQSEWHGSPSGRTSQFFDLEMLLTDDLTVNDLTTAIRTAWTAAGEGKEPPTDALRFHKETKLLIATGTGEQLSVVQSIVNLLKARSQPSADAKDVEIRNLTSQLQHLAAEYQDAKQRLSESEKAANDRIASFRERLAELEIELAKAKAQR